MDGVWALALVLLMPGMDILIGDLITIGDHLITDLLITELDTVLFLQDQFTGVEME
jgi:hypothetical protein